MRPYGDEGVIVDPGHGQGNLRRLPLASRAAPDLDTHVRQSQLAYTRPQVASGATKEEDAMPEQRTVERARRAAKQGKAPSTQAGEFVREEIEHVRHGKHGASSPEQSIAIGLSKARRAGVKLPPPKPGATSPSTRRKAERDYERGQGAAPAGQRARRLSGRRKAAGSARKASGGRRRARG